MLGLLVFSEVVVQLLSEVRGRLSEDPDEGHVWQGFFGEKAEKQRQSNVWDEMALKEFHKGELRERKELGNANITGREIY